MDGVATSVRAGHDNGLAYDTWYTTWARTRAVWLGETLAPYPTRAEQSIERWRRGRGRDPLFAARPAVLHAQYLHESQWSKRPG